MEYLGKLGGELYLFSADERAVILGALEAGSAPVAFLERLAQARRRTCARAVSDEETDARRRLLVGARIPRETAEVYRRCAREHEISLYRFVCNALEREHARLTKNSIE